MSFLKKFNRRSLLITTALLVVGLTVIYYFGFSSKIDAARANIHNIEGDTQLSERKDTSSLNMVKFPKEFELSDKEKSEAEKLFSKWKASSTSDLLMNIQNEAYSGDPVALYTVGQCSLSGRGTPINRDVANLHFKMSASLGYAPAIFELFQMYNTEKDDPLLALVYLNLTISHGHIEYRDLYYQLTEQLAQFAGQSVIKEIERIALDKFEKIFQIKDEMKTFKNTYMPALQLMRHTIVRDDFMYNEKYWKSFFKSELAWKQFFGLTDIVEGAK